MLNWRIIGFYCTPLLLALAVITGVQFKTDLSAFIVAGDQPQELLLASEMQSGALSKRYLISIESVQHKPVPEAVMQNLVMQFKAITGVSDVWLPEQNTHDINALQMLYGAHAGAWYSLNPTDDLARIFTEQGLLQRAELLKSALLSPQSQLVQSLALQDPLLLTLNGFQTQGAQQQALKAPVAYRNLVLETTMAGLDVPEQKRIQTAMKAAFDILNNASTERYQLNMTGVPVFAVATQSLIQGDIQVVSVLSTLGLLVLFILIFRSIPALLQVFSLLLIVILSAILTTQLVFGYVHGMTVAIGSTLVGICIDYPIHAIAHAQAVKSGQRLAVIAKIWPSMVMGGITTLVGYMALGASGYPGFKQVAIYATSGIIMSLLLTRFVLPLLLNNPTSQPLNMPLVARWEKFCLRFRPWLIGVLLIALATSLMGLKSLHWMTDMQELTPELNYLKQNDKRIRERMSSIEPGRFVLVTGSNSEAALQKSEVVYQVLDSLKHTQDLSEYYGLYPWVLSAKQQDKNRNLLQNYLTTDNLAHWQQALAQQGISIETLGHFDYAESTSLSLEKVLATPVKKLLDSRVIQNKNQTLLMIWLGEHQPEKLKAALAGMDGVHYFSQRDLLNEMVNDYTDRAQHLLLVGLVIIILLLMQRYKNVATTLQTLAPAILAAMMILGFWSLTGVAISFLHLVGFLLVIAICVDYGIFYQENRSGDRALTYQAMGAAMLTSALAFACLMVSESTSLKILSGVVVLGVILGFLLCPIMIKPNNQPTA